MEPNLRAAIVTASYAGDVDRCRLLCESIDRRVVGQTRHLILVEASDLALFRQFAGPRREIVDERELLPRLLRPFPDPTTGGRRRVWLSPFGLPLRGWHVQQLRRLAMASRLEETLMVSVDSDVVFLRDFDLSWFTETGAVKFFRQPGAVSAIGEPARSEHRAWAETAGKLLGLPKGSAGDTGYVATLLGWRTDTVRALKARVEQVGGREWMKILAGTRTLSECVLYGRFVEEVEGRPERHRPDGTELCAMYWAGDAMDAAALERLVRTLEPHQVAAGIQSFTQTDPALIRRVAGLS